MSISPSQSTALLISATKGFDHLFANDIVSSRNVFRDKDDPYHLLGLGVCAFLEAALAMEAPLMTEATRCLALAEAGSRKQAKASRAHVHRNKLSGLEWDILNADAVVLLGMTQALSESYMGYLQCMYSLNSAHSKFTKLYKTVFPNGLEGFTTTTTAPSSSSALLPLHLPPPQISSSSSSTSTSSSPGPSLPASPAASAPVSATSSVTSLSLPSEGTLTPPSPSPTYPTSPTSPSKPSSLHPPPRPPLPPASPSKRSFLGRLIGSAALPSASTPVLQTEKDHAHAQLTAEEQEEEEGPVSELVIAGTAFGFGLFNLVFSLLPKKVQSLVGFLGFKHDRKLALQALSVAAGKKDVHGVFSGLVLMTYHGVVLLMSGYQADEARIIAQYEAIVKDLEGRYPTGALWILNRAKILRMTGKGEEAIHVLEKGLEPDRVHSFKEADMVLVFELAWTLLAHRRYAEAADMFIKITDLNSWSHATYFFIASGCHFSLGNKAKAQELLDRTWEMFQDTKKIGGKELPTEVFIKKKVSFYKEKQARRGGDPARYVDAIMISPAEEMSIFWNNHARVDASIALERCAELVVLTPLPTIKTPSTTPLRSSSSTPISASSSVPNSASIPSTAGTSPSSVPSTTATTPDLDTPDELAIRSLLLGINYRTASLFPESRLFLTDAYQHQSSVKVSTWVGGVAMFELAVLDLKEVQAAEEGERLRGGSEKEEFSSRQELRSVEEEEEKKEEEMLEMWRNALRSAAEKLDVAAGAGLSGSSVDLSSRLDTRIAMLRDEIALKKEMLGI